MSQDEFGSVVVPLTQRHWKPAESCKNSVSLHEVHKGVPVMSEIDVQPYTEVQKPLTIYPLQLQLVVPVKPVMQLVHAVVLVQVRHPTIAVEHLTQNAEPLSR
jgi:hypothetical protein